MVGPCTASSVYMYCRPKRGVPSVVEESGGGVIAVNAAVQTRKEGVISQQSAGGFGIRTCVAGLECGVPGAVEESEGRVVPLHGRLLILLQHMHLQRRRRASTKVLINDHEQVSVLDQKCHTHASLSFCSKCTCGADIWGCYCSHGQHVSGRPATVSAEPACCRA